MLHAKIDGLTVAYRRKGDGPAIVLLHGFTQDSRVWSPQVKALSRHFTVIAWDAPGAGRSQDPPDTFRIGDWARTLAGLLDAIGVQAAHLLGLSWGGILAQEFCRLYSERVLSLILADTYAGWKGSLPEAIVQDRLAACLRDASLAPSDFLARYLPGMFGDSPPPAAPERLAKINQLREAIRGAKLAVIPGAGHMSNLEAAVRFNAEVLDFMGSIAGGDRQLPGS
jgi:pimeloyl-ACP methyl ester carboxylesterase